MVHSHSYYHVDPNSKGGQPREHTPLLHNSSSTSTSHPHPQQPHLIPSAPPAYNSISPSSAPAPIPIPIPVPVPLETHHHHHHYHHYDRERHPRHPTRSNNSNSCFCSFLTALLSTLFTLTFILLFLAIPLGYTYYAQLSTLDTDLERVLKAHVVFAGPDRVQLLNVTNWGVWVNVEGRIGVDAAGIVGVQRGGGDARPGDLYDYDERDLKKVWKAIGRGGIRGLRSVNVRLEDVEVWGVYNDGNGQGIVNEREQGQGQGRFFNVRLPPMDVPISADAPWDAKHNDQWLTPFSTPMFIKPTLGGRDILNMENMDRNTKALDTKDLDRKPLDFELMRDSDKSFDIQVRVKVAKIRLWGPVNATGRGALFEIWVGVVEAVGDVVGKTLRDVKVGSRVRLPSLPGFPDLL